MTTTGIAWRKTDRFDIHLLRGRSRRLDQLLEFEQDDGPNHNILTLPTADVARQSLTFVPRIKGVPVGRVVTAHGVRVDTHTGEVTAVTPLPADGVPVVSNLVVEARCRVDDPTAPGGTRDVFVTIRIHIHEAVTRAWCTPTPLSIHKGADRQRLSVLAEFSDGTVGDISRHPGLSWASADAGTVGVSPAGELSASGATGGAPVIITATLPLALDARVAAGQVRALDAWSSQPPETRKATLVAGPGRKVMANVQNVLFIAEGFPDTPGDRLAFEQFTAMAVSLLGTSLATSPFNLLKDSINYWRVFLPSNQSGETTLYELSPFTRGADLIGSGRVFYPAAPDPLTATPTIGPLPENLMYGLGNLIYLVGLAVPSDATDQATKGGEWTTMFDDVDQRRVSPQLFAAWRHMGDRRVANERDTALGLCIGERPAYDNVAVELTIGYHALRTRREQLDQFLRTVTDEAGVVIGATWDQHPPEGTLSGKNQDLVVALAYGARDSGTSRPADDPLHTELTALGLVSTAEVPLQKAAGREVDVLPNPLPPSIFGTGIFGTVVVLREVLATIAHEIAHSQLIGDEYAGKGAMPDDKLDRLRRFANLQPRDDLTAVPFAGLRGSQVKWRWPRLRRAGRVEVVARDPDDGGVYNVLLHAGHSASFTVPDVVRLRSPLPTGLDVAFLSDELQVMAIRSDTIGDVVTVHDVHGTLVPSDFPDGSVLCDPVPASATAALAGDTFAELMTQVIRDHIDTTGGPLNAPKGAPLRDCVNDRTVIQRARNLPAGLPAGRPRYPSWIVGLYEGGMEYDCGPYHPTGACMMRSVGGVPEKNPSTGERTTNPGEIYRFCHVCQYILVDRLDPSKHADLEALFAGKDPQP